MTTFLTSYISDGRYVPYTPSVDVAAGSVIVQGELVGVAVSDLPAGKLGDLCVDGLIKFPKATGNGSGFAAGSLLYWNAGAQVVTTYASAGANKYLGKNPLAAADADASVSVRFNPL